MSGQLASSAVHDILSQLEKSEYKVESSAILMASGRPLPSLEKILASHALIHTADGNHFRAALAQACAAQGLRVTRVPQRELAARAAAVLQQTPLQLRAAVDSLGHDLGPPWGADQKNAALLAWLLLGQAA